MRAAQLVFALFSCAPGTLACSAVQPARGGSGLGSVTGELVVRSGEAAVLTFGSSRVGFCALASSLVIFQSVSAVMFFFLLITLCSSPPPDSTLLRFLITLTRSPLFVWVCTGGVGLCARALDWLAAEGW